LCLSACEERCTRSRAGRKLDERPRSGTRQPLTGSCPIADGLDSTARASRPIIGHAGCVTVVALAEYPGRGLLVGRAADGSPFILYFVTGRSEASRSRRAVARGDGHIGIEPDRASASDDLRHYIAVASRTGLWVVGNGTHVAEIHAAAESFEDVFPGLGKVAYEPDPPICTPRIVGALETSRDGEMGRIGVGAARHGKASDVEHVWLEAAQTQPGHAMMIRTYVGHVDDPRTHAEPSWTRIRSTIRGTADELWARLDVRYRVVLVAIDVIAGATVVFHRNRPEDPVVLRP